MFSIFKKKPKPIDTSLLEPILTDMHSHVLPGLDDGSPDVETSLELAKGLVELGYKKLICTPHVMSDFYRNTPETINEAAAKLREALTKQNINLELEIAAEYYLDEAFLAKIEEQEQLLSFGDKYILFETPFMNPSAFTDKAIFQLQSLGYKPVLAHPERYVYMYGKYGKLAQMHEKGVLLQVNINSLTGYYSKDAKKVAEQLIEDRMVSFLGTDCHHTRHINMLHKAKENPYYAAALNLPLLNRNL